MTLQNEIEKLKKEFYKRFKHDIAVMDEVTAWKWLEPEIASLIQDREKKAWEDGYAYKLTGFKEFKDKEYLKEDK